MLDFVFILFEISIRFFGIIFTLMLIIFVHELGHYLFGRWCGIGISVFSLGFGPKLFGYTDKQGTQWQLSLIPCGGYVKFSGDVDHAICIEKQVKINKNLAFDSFIFANVWKRVATVFAGPLFSIIFAIILLSFLFFFAGRTILLPKVADIISGSPSEQAGIRIGDKIISVHGKKINSFFDISRYIMNYEDKPITFVIERNGYEQEIIVTPQMKRVDDGFGNPVHTARIGIIASVDSENIRQITYTFSESLLQGTEDTIHMIKSTWHFLRNFFQGRGDRCQLSGPLRSAEIAWKVSGFGFLALLKLAAFFSVNVGVFNLFPLPPLDGGHLFFYFIEGITGCHVSLWIKDIFFRGGMLVILSLILFTIINNIIPC